MANFDTGVTAPTNVLLAGITGTLRYTPGQTLQYYFGNSTESYFGYDPLGALGLNGDRTGFGFQNEMFDRNVLFL